MKRSGPTHYFIDFAYQLHLACGPVRHADANKRHHSTRWDDVTCKQCLAKRPEPVLRQ